MMVGCYIGQISHVDLEERAPKSFLHRFHQEIADNTYVSIVAAEQYW